MALAPPETIFLYRNTTHVSSGNADDEHYNASKIDYNQFDPVSTGALASRLNWSFLSLFILIVATAAGNLMVCAAVFQERSLQNMPNYFLTSLAVADFLVSVFIMPPGLVVLVFGYFPLHPSLCVVWASLDVLMCTASIWHMCILSVDRYLTLRYPMKYGRNRSKATTVLKITSVWIISVVVCSPLAVTGFLDYSNVYINHTCVPSMKHFVLYGSVMAFYVPLIIMLVTYTLTVNILRRNHRLMKLLTLSSNRRRGRPLRRTASEMTGRTGRLFLRPGSPSNTALPTIGNPSSVLDTTSVSYLTASSSIHTGSKPSATPSVERRSPVSGLEPTAACSQDGVSSATLLPPFQERLTVSSMSITTSQSPAMAHASPARWQFSRSQPSLSNLSAGNAAGSRSKPLTTTWSCGGSVKGVHMTSAKTISELESVRNFDFLSAGTSMNSMPSNSSWSSASWNEQVMFERMSLIEAEMDECLMETDEHKSTDSVPSDKQTEEPVRHDADSESPEADTSRQKMLAEDTTAKTNSNGVDVLTSQSNGFATTIGISPPSTPTGSSLGTPLCEATKSTLEFCTQQIPADANLRRGSVSVPIDLCAENLYISPTCLNWIGYGSASSQRNVHRTNSKSLRIKEKPANNYSNSSTEPNSEEPSRRALLRSSSSSDNEAGSFSSSSSWVAVEAGSTESQPRLVRLADAVSKSLGAQLQLVSVLSYYSPPRRRSCRGSRKPRTSPGQSSTSLGVKGVDDNKQRLRPPVQSRLNATLASGENSEKVVGKIAIILTSETSDFDSKAQTTGDFRLDYTVRSAANQLSFIPDTFSSLSHSLIRTPSSRLGTTSSVTSLESDEAAVTVECSARHQTASITDGGFHRIPPVTVSSPVSSPEDRRSSSVSDHPLSCRRGLQTHSGVTGKDELEVQNWITPGVGAGVSESSARDCKGLRRSPDFLTVQSCHRNSDSDPEGSSVSSRRTRYDSCSTISDDTSSEVVVKATLKSAYLRSWQRRRPSKPSLMGSTCCLCRRSMDGGRSRNNSELELVLSKKVSRNERKASKVLGIILLAFVVFWFPFFLVNVLSAICKTCEEWLNSTVATSVVWLGYASSLANPVIYTLFSKSFRTAFRRILTCSARRHHHKKRSSLWNKSFRGRAGNVYCENAV